MSDDYFGSKPKVRNLFLEDGQDFNLILRNKNEAGVVTDYPAGTTIKFVFADGVEWAATIVGALATFAVDKAVTATRPIGTTFRVVYAANGLDLVPFKGQVVRGV